MLVRNEQITPALAETVATILREDYQDSAVMKLESYSRQAVVLNNRIWKRCFSEPEQAPELIYLELEKIASIPSATGNMELETIFDDKQNCYQVIAQGWQGKRRTHGCLFHIELKGEKVWLQHYY